MNFRPGWWRGTIGHHLDFTGLVYDPALRLLRQTPKIVTPNGYCISSNAPDNAFFITGEPAPAGELNPGRGNNKR